MPNNEFIIEILDLHWITPEDDGNDLCAHGHLYLKIRDTVVSDIEIGDWTLSSTALYLLRSLENDYEKDDFGTQLLPCCGHFFIADDNEEKVIIQGCDTGIDWKIIHDGNTVKHILDNGQEGIIDIEEYKKIVFDFADKIEQFYNDSLPKNIPTDDFDRKGYLTFWKEWRRLRDQ